MGFSRPVCFDGAAAILVCKSERDLGRVSILTPTPAPLGSLDTLPRSRSLLQTHGGGSMEAYRSRESMEGNIGQKCGWIVPYCFVFSDAMNLPVQYYVVPGRMLYRNSDGIVSYPVTQLILRHAIISYPMMICRTSDAISYPDVVPGDAMSYPVMQCRTR